MLYVKQRTNTAPLISIRRQLLLFEVMLGWLIITAIISQTFSFGTTSYHLRVHRGQGLVSRSFAMSMGSGPDPSLRSPYSDHVTAHPPLLSGKQVRAMIAAAMISIPTILFNPHASLASSGSVEGYNPKQYEPIFRTQSPGEEGRVKC
jgi:hypothetical protein